MIAAIAIAWLICAAIVTVALLASCVKAAEADARLREDDER